MEKCIEKLLVLSIKFDQSTRWHIRFLGTVLGIFPLWYAAYLEKKYNGGKKRSIKNKDKKNKNKKKKNKNKNKNR